jgi:hypothetical protein
MRAIRIIAATVLLAFAGSQGAAAQSDFLKQGQDLLRGLGGNSSSGSGGGSGGGAASALSDRVVAQVGAVDGFNADPTIHIPLPDSLATVRNTLARVGMAGMMDDLELRLNRAAEAAAPEAQQLFWQAIDEMSWDDVRGIYEGPDDAATRYLEGRMSAPLAARMKPIVENSLAEVGAIAAYDRSMARYRSVPFVPDVKADLTDHVLDRALAGLFLYLATEEAAIRENPAKRSTELLRKVFAN